MAQKKGQGTSKNGRDSKSKRLGIKCYDGEKVKSGYILIRQRGSKFRPLKNTYMGKDFTIHSKIDGYVKWDAKRRYVSVNNL